MGDVQWQVDLVFDRLRSMTARPGVELNFNAIGKGYALDRIAAGLRQPAVRLGPLHGERFLHA
jgi:thiamine biosynthesis lipoprotein ApbE